MLTAIMKWLIVSLSLILIASIIPGISISSFGVALVAAFIIGLVNLLVRPLVSLLTLPLNILTLGLFSFIINALMFGLAAYLVPGFEVSGFLPALVGSLLLAFVNAVMENALGRREALR